MTGYDQKCHGTDYNHPQERAHSNRGQGNGAGGREGAGELGMQAPNASAVDVLDGFSTPRSRAKNVANANIAMTPRSLAQGKRERMSEERERERDGNGRGRGRARERFWDDTSESCCICHGAVLTCRLVWLGHGLSWIP